MPTITAADPKCAALPYYQPYKIPKRSSAPGAKPFRWEDVDKSPFHLPPGPARDKAMTALAGKEARRLKGNRDLTVRMRDGRIVEDGPGIERRLELTWQGEYPDAPPSGMGPCAQSSWTEPVQGCFCVCPEVSRHTWATVARDVGFYPVERVA